MSNEKNLLEPQKTVNEKHDIELDLQLGDVINITNPVNDNLNDQTFIIDYIDNSKTYLINVDTLNRIKVNISPDGILGDGNITKIEILSRADSPSYARQNKLLPGKWIKIFFSDPTPAIIVGEITNLEQDMIEIRTTDKDIIYINFDYKGIPENLPIDAIEIVEKPASYVPEKDVKDEDEVVEDKDIDNYIPDLEREKQVVDVNKIQVVVPVKDVKDQLREIIIKADQVVFGDEELGPIVQFVDVSAKLQRYSIETQVADLLDDLLSTVPNAQRTPRVLNNIHITIERFKQLREQFSTFDQYGNVESIVFKSAFYKPLQTWLQSFNENLYWILPVVKNIKKVYDVESMGDLNEDFENNDVINLDLERDIVNMNELIENYRSNNFPSEINKYTALYAELAPYYRPFTYVNAEERSDIIIEKEVNANINVVINNLEDLYSSVFSNNMIRNRRFVISKYNLGETKLDITEATNARMTTVRVKLTDNDLMSVKSIMTLPEPTIRFSKINLPGTDILSKANLNQIFINYWQLLKKKTNVVDIFVESLENEFEFNENDFVNGIRNYVMNIPEEETRGMNKKDIYSKYVNSIVPKTRMLFNLMKKYIKGKLSIIDVVGYLEPFLIYVDDLTFNQYTEIVQFIDSKISEYNKHMIEFSRIFKVIENIKQLPVVKTKAFPIIAIINSLTADDIFNVGYQLENPEANNTNSEILRKIIIKDNSRLYTTALSVQNLKLMFPKDVSEIFETEQKSNEDKLKEEDKSDTCKTITIAKLYTTIEQLERDNDAITYFDKKYDKTNYGVMEDHKGYADKVISMSPEKLKEHIIVDQMKKNNMSEKDATYFAETLIDGAKRVIDGQYAILYKGYAENIEDESDYYIRKNGKWVIDKEIKPDQKVTDESSIMCDLQEKCISKNDDTCESMKSSELHLQNELLTNIISEFDAKYKMSKEEFEKEVNKKFEYFLSIMPIISKIETNSLLKYNNQKYKLGTNLDDEYKNHITSPFAPLLDIILGQKDFIKKQNDIIKFANKFTRIGTIGMTPEGKQETSHWLYCTKTGVPLLPAFKKELAAAFVTSQYTYQSVLEQIKSSNGQLSDDGDWWTDKYTGWPICPGDFDTEEGYDEGFKVVSRSVMEESAGNKILSATTERTIRYITPESIMINNIVNALSVAMGINIESQKEFIINSVIETIKTSVESETDYKEQVKLAAQKGKVIASYRDFFNASLLYFTLGMYLIAIQTIIPSIKTRKTHPGCIRSFTGYPFDGQGDYSSVSYLACVTYDIRDSGEPWNVLKKTNAAKIQARIQTVIDNSLIQLPDVQRKCKEKTEYLLTHSSNEIAEEHDISKWSDFLPPLVPFKIRHLVNISEEFKRSLLNDLRSGSENQREKILVIESKIIQFSLALQEKIQHIVKTHKVLLHTNNNEPYLENACCDSKENETTVGYFASRNKDILEYNKIVERLANILDDVRSNTEPLIFYSNINTKNVYPPVSNTFNEKIVYTAFIFYCKFKSLLPIPEDLLPLCTNKPDNNLINPSDSVDRIIQKLKEDGRNYTNEQFLRLIQLISRENIVNIELDNPVISCIAKLSNLLGELYDENNEDEVVELALRDLIADAIDTFNIASENMTPQVKALNNYLIRTNEEMTNELVEFVQKNSSSTTSRGLIKNYINTIKELSTWSFDTSNRNEDIKISSDSMYTITNFYKTFISNFTSVFPNIILNKVNYDNTHIPKYYGFSKIHASKLVKNVSNYFDKLKKFYGVDAITKIATTIQTKCKNVVRLADSTPCFSSIRNEDTLLRGIIDDRTSRYLFEYYLLRVLITYIELANNTDMIVTEIKKPSEVTDIYSVEYIDETETRIDLGVSSRIKTDNRILTGNLRKLKEETAEMLIAFVNILSNEKDIIDTTYEDVQDKVFKLREKEKDMVTDRLKAMTDEERDADTILKITKQGLYSKGLQKGLTMYDKDFYDEEQTMRDELLKAEKKIRQNKDVHDDNVDIMLDEYLEQNIAENEIDRDAYDMSHLNETYYDGNYDGVDAPEEEYDDYDQEN
jgi:hypothetical protein